MLLLHQLLLLVVVVVVVGDGTYIRVTLRRDYALPV